MRSGFGAYGLAAASLAALVSGQSAGSFSDADLSPVPDSRTSGINAQGSVRTFSTPTEGPVYIMDTRGAIGSDPTVETDFLEVTIPVTWPADTVAGTPFNVRMDIRVTNPDQHYFSETPPEPADIAIPDQMCRLRILVTYGPLSTMIDNINDAFPRLVKEVRPLPRDDIAVGQEGAETNTEYGFEDGFPLMVPENFEDYQPIVYARVDCLPEVPADGPNPAIPNTPNDIQIARVRISVPEVPASTATTAAPTGSETELPIPTETELPIPTETELPLPTETGTEFPIPTETDVPFPTETDVPFPTETETEFPVPTETETSTGTATDGSVLPTGTSTETSTGTSTETTGTSTGPTATSTALPGPVRIGDYRYTGCVSNPPSSQGSSPFALAATRADNTPEVCIGICQGQNKTLAGAFGADCYCGSADPSSLSTVPNSECDVPCPGNPAEFCGGRREEIVLRNLRHIAARQTPASDIYLTVYVFLLLVDEPSTTVTVPGSSPTGTTINNINNNVNNVNISINIMIPVTCLPGACETEVYFERACEVCHPDEDVWTPIKCAGDACVGKPVCRPEPAPTCVHDCFVKTPCTTCDGGVIYKHQPAATAHAAPATPDHVAPATPDHVAPMAPHHTKPAAAYPTMSDGSPVVVAAAVPGFAANMGAIFAAMAPVAVVFFA